jgi:hypothetical protein
MEWSEVQTRDSIYLNLGGGDLIIMVQKYFGELYVG